MHFNRTQTSLEDRLHSLFPFLCALAIFRIDHLIWLYRSILTDSPIKQMGPHGEREKLLAPVLLGFESTTSGREFFLMPTSRWRTVTAHLLFIKSHHRAIDSC